MTDQASTTTSTPTRPAPAQLVTGLNHAGLLTGDLRRLATFYAEVFDAEIVDIPAPPGTRAAMVRLSERSALALMEPLDGSEELVGATPMLQRGHIDHLAFDAPSAAALEELRCRLVDRGASDGVVHDYGPLLCVAFEDPDGMQTEVCWLRDPSFDGAGPPTVFAGSLLDLER